jgi:thiol-disulfide isomerase/thioredoxin
VRRLLPLVLALALAGCIQVQMPAAPATAPSSGAPAAPPSSYAVACQLRDENGTPLRQGTCEYRFGTLGATVPVDGNGTTVRRVPAGATGTLAGSAPGRAGAQASLTVTNDKNVRMTLPRLPKAPPPPPPQANATAPGNASADAVDPDANGTANVTVFYDSHRDLLFRQTYLILPGDVPVVQEYEFDVAPEYQTLEIVGSYLEPYVYAAWPMLRVYDPHGKQVIAYDGLDAAAVATGTGGGTNTPMGFLLAPEPGTYRVSIQGAGVPALELSAYGLAGLAPDFTFTNFTTGQALRLNDFAGRVVIVDLMASWCGPCNDAMPGLAQMREDYGGKVEVLSVDVDPGGPQGDPPEDLRAFIERHHVTWPIGYESGGSASDAYGTGWIPTMVLVDQHGGLLYRHIGEIDQAELRARIDAALAA